MKISKCSLCDSREILYATSYGLWFCSKCRKLDLAGRIQILDVTIPKCSKCGEVLDCDGCVSFRERGGLKL